jgi:hypothetical protein
VDGSSGSLAWNAESPNQLWVGYRDRSNETMLKDPALMSASARPYAGFPGGHAEGYPDTFVQFFKDVYTYISGGDYRAPRPFPTFHAGHEGVCLCEAVATSVEQGRWVKPIC